MYEQIYKSTDDGSPASSLQLHTANASTNNSSSNSSSNNSHAPQSYSKLHVQTADTNSASQQVKFVHLKLQKLSHGAYTLCRGVCRLCLQYYDFSGAYVQSSAVQVLHVLPRSTTVCMHAS
jgi:hypothetical protein